MIMGYSNIDPGALSTYNKIPPRQMGEGVLLLIRDPAHQQAAEISSGAEGIRTPGLLNAIQSLSQLSYSPKLFDW
jgi:hypothetical protein